MIHQSYDIISVCVSGDDDADLTYSAVFASIETKIDRWVADKRFTKPGITLDKLAAELYTNRSYLSFYINKYRKQTFRRWISGLRIEEAKRLLLQYPDVNLQEIAFRAGFSERSHFTHQFTGQTGISPKFWRQQHKS
ncbi:MAG: helix-turn-helix domain-containing protein [Tannerella sp.]|jgi:AraC-like DNA-binding protein|nr:helix-turn-helix domain-containing protein [Tannerella sp.]